MSTLLFILGLLFLIMGAELLVRGSSRLAEAAGISPLIVGLTVVAFGTSSPELAVSIKSALSGQGGIALGNVIGSNIFNVLFILGLSAMIIPLRVNHQLVRVDVPLMIFLSIIVLLFSLDGVIGFTNGILLLAALILYIIQLYFQNRRQNAAEHVDTNEAVIRNQKTGSWGVNVLFVVVGLALLILGSRWLVNSAVTFAQHLGVSELIIGLTIVAAGTSLPEVVTSIIAAFRGERDIAVGNIVGSNIFNIVAVLGISGMVAPAGIEVSDAVLRFDMPVMIAIAFACLPLFFTRGEISRWEGVLLFGYYIAYTAYLLLAASQHDSLPVFSSVMFYFAIPITLITIMVLGYQEFYARKSDPKAES